MANTEWSLVRIQNNAPYAMEIANYNAASPEQRELMLNQNFIERESGMVTRSSAVRVTVLAEAQIVGKEAGYHPEAYDLLTDQNLAGIVAAFVRVEQNMPSIEAREQRLGSALSRIRAAATRTNIPEIRPENKSVSQSVQGSSREAVIYEMLSVLGHRLVEDDEDNMMYRWLTAEMKTMSPLEKEELLALMAENPHTFEGMMRKGKDLSRYQRKYQQSAENE